ncbi:MAG: zinc dependent phospholipase C family protein [Methanobacteriaceae archaeon]
MIKVLTSLFTVLIFALALAPTSVAWSGITHKDIVDEVYYSLPADAQQNLILDEMRNGSDDPDYKFFDFSYHRYPASYQKADYWLDRAELAYQNGDYHQASYSLGVASHYISDSFDGPHCVSASTGYHTLYEVQATLLTPKITYKSGNLKSLMANGHLKGEYSWNSWMMTRDLFYVQDDLDRATSACYVAISNRV